MRRVRLNSPEGRALVNRGPAWREHPDYYADEPPEFERVQWVNEERTVLVVQWEDGRLTVATRQDSDAIWGPPTEVQVER